MKKAAIFIPLRNRAADKEIQNDMKLVIVESPTKAKTIERFLDKSYKIVASVGHIRDLPKSNKKAIDIAGGFIPHYEISKGKEKIVSEIKKLYQKAEEILLATDPDREGEAIAWHIIQAIGLENSKLEMRNTKPKRIVFHEITKNAILDALKHPRGIDENLKTAQEARRVLDRLVGYDLSGLIWKKVRYGLSAGRVQSPALRIIMEKEREIRAFIPENYWVINGAYKTKNKETLLLTCEEEPRNKDEAERIISTGKSAKSWHITKIKLTEVRRSPRAPFITSTLQQAASSRIGFSPSRTMSLAQKLYEQGLITYMRTDSPNISRDAISAISSEIEKIYGKEYLSPRTYATKSKTAQEAHEAIRPTNIHTKNAGNTEEQKKLYKLIWERAIASQMADAKIARTKISANIADKDGKIPDFSANGNVIIFPGWLAADTRSRGEEIELPKTEEGEPLVLISLEGEMKQTEPPQRYTEAGLIKELEKREIGRPSTYATIMKTLFDRGYIVKEGRALLPTDVGEVVSNFLEQNFAQYISDSFTAEMERELDEIAEGKRDYRKSLEDFYGPFSKEVKSKEHIEKITSLGDADDEHKCPICKGPMVIKLARNGKFLSCKKFPECIGARKIDGNELEPPKEIGEECPECEGKLIEREGRFGKFIACGNYPKCKYIKKNNGNNHFGTTGVGCPECNKVIANNTNDNPNNTSNGEIVERRGRFGPFYSCSNYPNCKFIIKSRPTGNKCKLCGSLMMQGTKTIPERCSNKNCLNHNPHRLKK